MPVQAQTDSKLQPTVIQASEAAENTIHSERLPGNLLLAKADSLYDKHKFADALLIYKYLLNTEKAASPRMLLKMAAITEPSQDYASMLYYLNLYYLQNPGTAVKRRIEDIAERQNLTGYGADTDFFLYLYTQHYTLILGCTAGLAFLLLSAASWRRFRKMRLDYYPFFIPAVLVIGFTLANLTSLYSTGIIKGTKVWLMDAPASGAHLVDIAGPGHKVTIRSHTDMWYRIWWKGTDAYINADNLMILEN